MKEDNKKGSNQTATIDKTTNKPQSRRQYAVPPGMTPRQAAIRRRAAVRRRNRVIISLIAAIILVVAAIVVYAVVSTVTNFSNLAANSNRDIAPFTIGSKDAKVTLIQYADLRDAGAASYFNTTLPDLLKKYVANGQVKVEFRNNVYIDSRLGDSNSSRSAQAAYCASEQNRSWDYVTALYNNTVGETAGKPDDKYLKDLAYVLGMDTGKFNSCLSSGRYRPNVNDDTKAAQAKVSGQNLSLFIKRANGVETAYTDTPGDGLKLGIALDQAYSESLLPSTTTPTTTAPPVTTPTGNS